MYFNVFGERVSRKRYEEMLQVAENRRELVAAGLTSRRDLMKLGLLTAGGMLVAKSGLSAQVQTQILPAPAFIRSSAHAVSSPSQLPLDPTPTCRG